jgi:hypothetical protein
MAINDVKFVRRVRFRIGSGFQTRSYELRDAAVRFEVRANDFTLVDGTFVREVIWYRLLFSFSTPYLRKADNISTDIIEWLDTSQPVFLELPDIDEDISIKVLPINDRYTATVEGQRLIPNQDWEFRAVDVLTELPDWFKQARSKPEYI